MNQEINIGVVGFGWWGRELTKTFRSIDGVKITAVGEKRDDLPAEVLGDAKHYTDLREMFDREKLDGVIISVPPPNHLEPALLAAEKGVHVFCEKPMAASLEDCDRMIR
ncbi:MAG: Gfo/Idh/MocA family oxidoreductase, partial [Victivallaceae bacterium]|nr:Gfo/Idh/MocA family oxidoreductase [Victivallaceae bacterium]